MIYGPNLVIIGDILLLVRVNCVQKQFLRYYTLPQKDFSPCRWLNIKRLENNKKMIEDVFVENIDNTFQPSLTYVVV